MTMNNQRPLLRPLAIALLASAFAMAGCTPAPNPGAGPRTVSHTMRDRR